jgi:hypothetical protein
MTEGLAEPQIVAPADLDDATRQAMYALLDAAFLGVTPARFEDDLAAKSWVILLRSAADQRLVGFSTQQRLETTVCGQRVVALFSGDTIVARAAWGEWALARAWARVAFDLADRCAPLPAYWFLICSGYRTYRFLPVFFREFYPRSERATPPAERRILDALAHGKFGTQYDPALGIVRFDVPTPLRAGISELDARLLSDPTIAFFAKVNPAHARGDELACLTRITRENLTPAGARMLRPR